MIRGLEARRRSGAVRGKLALLACTIGVMVLGAGGTFAQAANDDNIYNAERGRPALGGFYRPVPGLRPIYFVEGKQLPRRDVDQQQFEFPYKVEWQKVLSDRQAGGRAEKPYGDPSGSCFPQGMFHDYVGYPSPVEITQTPGRFQIVHERLTQVRRIFTDGRPHTPSDKLVLTSHGESVGHWEGDTLVVDTVGVRREFTIGFGMPHSERVHFVERFHKADADTLLIDVTIDDPVAMVKPASTTLTYKRSPPGDLTTEDFCAENNRNVPDENLIVTVDMSPRKSYGFDLPPGAVEGGE